MVKTVLKEIGIILLILLAETLLLGVLFYGFIPTNNIVPSKVAPYALPENISQVLNASLATRRKYNKNISNRFFRFKII